MFDHLLLIACIFITLGVIVYLFYANQLIGLALSTLLRIWTWTQGSGAVWIHFGSVHVSLLAGRISIKDVRYHSSNQTIKVVRCRIHWRYWIRRPMDEDDLNHARAVGEEIYEKHAFRPFPCRIQIKIEGLEWAMYNRTAAYDHIVSELGLRNSQPGTPAGMSTNGRGTPVQDVFAKPISRQGTAIYPPSSTAQTSVRRLPRWATRLLDWLHRQLPRLDPKELLPVGLEITKAAIMCGNASTTSVLLVEFERGDGIAGIVPSRSSCDHHKQTVNLALKEPRIRYLENPDYQDQMTSIGRDIHAKVKRSAKGRWPSYLAYVPFAKYWRRLGLASLVSKPKPRPQRRNSAAGETLRRRLSGKARKPVEEETPVGADCGRAEYAIEREVLEAPSLEIAYYVDDVGLVPSDAREGSEDQFDIGNGALPPEWGVDIVVRGGTLHYGPWADRQRADLQRAFFPPMYLDAEATPRLKPGDQRVWTMMKVFIELRDGTTLHIPFRESSKNWQWDGEVPYPRPKKRQPANINVKVGDGSTISYIMPMVAGPQGYEPHLEVHLDAVTVTSSLNDIRLLSAESCRVRCDLPAPLQWRAERQWTFAVFLRQPVLYLLRDHVNMFTDLSKDWATGPPSDYFRWVPMVYGLEIDLRNYEINTYNNDLNIIDRPLLKDENALLTLSGDNMRSSVTIDSSTFRALETTVPFWIEAPRVSVHLTLPKWNTHAFDGQQHQWSEIGHIGLLRLDASYRYFADVREDNVEHLKLAFSARDVVYRAFGWTIRHFMLLRDNYFGSFTHFSTLNEYLAKQRRGAPVGDPIELQYRPGKSNVLAVELQLDLKRGVMILPSALHGYHRLPDGSGVSAHPTLSSPCVVLSLPSMQVQLRTHDYAMEMSLNIDLVKGSIRESFPAELSVDLTRSTGPKEVFVIDDIDIVANRLFGPQPRTSTYVCIWEIHIESIRTAFSASESNIITTVLDIFLLNFNDPLNAPAVDFVLPTDPDVTFLSISLGTLDATWLAGQVALNVVLPEGLLFQSNDLASQSYRKVLSVQVPTLAIKVLLVPSNGRDNWWEAASLTLDVDLDMYSSPLGWRDTARAQTEFVLREDSLTGRMSDLLTSLAAGNLRNIPMLPSFKKILNGLHLCRLQAPTPKPTRAAQEPDPFSARRQSISSAVSHSSVSDVEGRRFRRDPDAELASSRRSALKETHYAATDEGETVSGEESDDEDLVEESETDEEVFDDVPSETSASLRQYSRFTRRYTSQIRQPPSFWTDLAFILAKDLPSVVAQPSSKARRRASVPSSAIPPHILQDRKTDNTVLRVSSRGIVVYVTPMVLHGLDGLLKDRDPQAILPEFLLQSIATSYVEAFDKSSPPARAFSFQVDLSSVQARCLQFVARQDLKEREQADGYFPSVEEQVTMLCLNLQNVHVLGSLKHVSEEAPPLLALSSSVETASGKLVPLSNKQARLQAKTAEDSITFHIDRLKLSVANRSLRVDLAGSRLTVTHAAPEHAIATALAVGEAASGLLRTQAESATRTLKVRRHIIQTVLQHTQGKTFVDPFSTIQPSYLVQTGHPHRLRTDPCLRMLVHLATNFQALDATSRKQLRDMPEGQDLHTQLDIIAALLETQIQNLTLDQEAFSAVRGPLLSALSLEQASVPVKSSGDSPFNAASVSLTNVRLIVKGPSGESDCSLASESVTISGQHRPSEWIPVKQEEAAYDIDLRNIRPIAASATIGASVLTASPHLLVFVKQVLRAKRRMPPPQPKIKTPSIDRSHRPLFIEGAVSVQDFRVQAAAANLILEGGVSGLTFSGGMSTRRPGRSREPDTAGSASLIFRQSYLRARSAIQEAKQPIHPERDVLASLEFAGGKGTLLLQLVPRLRTTTRVAAAIESIRLRVPRSALRLYKFVEGWRADYLPALRSMMEDVVTEMKSTTMTPPPRAVKDKRLVALQVQLAVTSMRVALRVMPRTWLSWEVLSTTAYMHSAPNPRRASLRFFGVQVGSQVISVSPPHDAGEDLDPATSIKIKVPTLSMSGRFDDAGLDALAAVDFFHVTVKPSHWDTVLSVQQKFGNDFQDLISLFEKSRQANTTSSISPSSKNFKPWKYAGSLKMRGFRIGLEGPASTLYLECEDIGGNINNDQDRVVRVYFSDLALSLAPGPRVRSSDLTFNRKQKSAFVILDVQVDISGLEPSQGVDEEGRLLKISVPKVHAVMQPSSTGEFGDFVDHLQREILLRQEQRAMQLQEFKEKTQQLMKTFDLKAKDSDATIVREDHSWLDKYTIAVTIRNIGVAFPLTLDQNLQVPQTRTKDAPSVPAFLFSISSLGFNTVHGESGQAVMKGFCFQFVPRFRQSVADDFASEAHRSRNRLIYPEMTAQARSERFKDSRRIRLGAEVSGFIVDIDSSLPDYVFSLIEVYRQGKERMSRLTTNLPRTVPPPERSSVPEKPDAERHTAIPTSNILASLSFRSGEVRLHSSSTANASRTLSDTLFNPVNSEAEVFRLPEVSVWSEYRASSFGAQKGVDTVNQPSTLTFKSTVHSSQNTLHPTMLPFLADFNDRLEARMKKSRWQSPDHSPEASSEEVATETGASPPMPTTSSMEVTFGLRIDQSKLELTCQPDVNVVAGVHWESGGFVVNIAPGARRVAFTGSVGGLTVGLKHGFLSEDCVKLHAHNLAFSTAFARSEDGGNTVSVVVDTEFSGGARLSRLQDMLCFKAVWLDRIPTFGTQSQPAPPTPMKANVSLPSISPPPAPNQEFTTVLLIRVRRIELDLDLGQSISMVKLELTDALGRTKLTQAMSEISINIAHVAVNAAGNVSGHAEVPDFIFQTVRRRELQDVDSMSEGNRMLELTLTSGPLVVNLDSEHQQLLHYRAEPISVLVFDDWSQISTRQPSQDRRLNLSVSVTGTHIVAIVTLVTIPKLVAYMEKFKANVEAQREGASRESQAFRVARQPKPENPLSAVANAMLQNARTRFKEAEKAISYVVVQEMSLGLDALQLYLFPHSMLDTELARFTGRGVLACLERTVGSDGELSQRDVKLSFSSMAISKLTNLNHTFAAQEPEKSGEAWLRLIMRRAPAATIFQLPAMRMQMESEERREADGRRALVYDFVSRFVRGAGARRDDEEIYISLNISLYSWLTVLRRSFDREMSIATKSAKPPAASPVPTPVRRKYPEPLTMKGQEGLGAGQSQGIAAKRARSPPRPLELEPPADTVRPNAAKHRSVPLFSPAMLSTTGRALSFEEPSPAASVGTDPLSSPDALSPLSPAFTLKDKGSASRSQSQSRIPLSQSPFVSPAGSPTRAQFDAPRVQSPALTEPASPVGEGRGMSYVPRTRQIERLTMRQLGEATPDVTHPFFMKKAGFNLEESLPQYVHEYATAPLEEIMEALLELYGRQLRAGRVVKRRARSGEEGEAASGSRSSMSPDGPSGL